MSAIQRIGSKSRRAGTGGRTHNGLPLLANGNVISLNHSSAIQSAPRSSSESVYGDLGNEPMPSHKVSSEPTVDTAREYLDNF